MGLRRIPFVSSVSYAYISLNFAYKKYLFYVVQSFYYFKLHIIVFGRKVSNLSWKFYDLKVPGAGNNHSCILISSTTENKVLRNVNT